MSSPVKDSGMTDSVFNISNLKSYDTKLLVLGSLCINSSGKIDPEKLARLAGIKSSSANSNYGRAKKRLMNILGEEAQTEVAGTKHESPEATPTKRRAYKRRKTVVKPVSEDEQAEEATDNNEASADAITTTVEDEIDG